MTNHAALSCAHPAFSRNPDCIRAESGGFPLTRPRALDLFCKAGGAAMGLYRAGFDVVGVDIEDQPRYPFDFVQCDALAYLDAGGAEGFDFIWASPPCQVHSSLAANLLNGHSHRDMIADTRERLRNTGLPYVIENVIGAPLIRPLMLCGTMFGLQADADGCTYELRRHRLFETSWFIWNPPECRHRNPVLGVYGDLASKPRCNNPNRPGHGVKAGVAEAESLLGIEWMTAKELSQAIPPAYSEYIGGQVIDMLERRRLTGGTR